jgi:hypothetical protein
VVCLNEFSTEAIKESGSAPDGECCKNEYGSEHFILLVQAPPTYAPGKGISGLAVYHGSTVFAYDCRRSVCMQNGPGDYVVSMARGGLPIPVHKEGYKKFL